MHYKIALIINYLGHCISVGALVVAFILFLCLRQVQKQCIFQTCPVCTSWKTISEIHIILTLLIINLLMSDEQNSAAQPRWSTQARKGLMCVSQHLCLKLYLFSYPGFKTHTHTLPLDISVMTKEGKHQHPEILCVLRLDQYGLLKANTDYFMETKIVIVF